MSRSRHFFAENEADDFDDSYILHSLHPDMKHDDLRIIDRREIPDGKENAKGYVYQLWLSSDDTPGVWQKYVEVVYLARVDFMPRELRENQGIMEIQDDILHALWQRDIFFFMLCANIKKPKPLGLLYCYGVRVLQEVPLDPGNEDEALEFAYNAAINQAEADFQALTDLLKGNYKQFRMKLLTMEHAKMIRNTLESASNLQVLRGIPKTHMASGQGLGRGLIQQNPTPKSQEQNEQFLRGMMKHQFAMLVLATPIRKREIHNQLELIARRYGLYKSLAQQTDSFTASVGAPMMFGGNLSASLAHTQGAGETDSTAQSVTETNTITDTAGITTGEALSRQNSIGTGVNIGEALSTNETVTQGAGTAHSVTNGTSDTVTASHTDGRSITDTRGQTVTNTVAQNYANTNTIGAATTETNGTSATITRTHTSGDTVGESMTRTSGTTSATGHTSSEMSSVASSNTQSAGGSRTMTSADGSTYGNGNTTGITGQVSGSLFGLVNVGGGGNASGTETFGGSHTDSMANGANWNSAAGLTQTAGQSSGTTQTTGVNNSLSQGFQRSHSESDSLGRADGVNHSLGNTASASTSAMTGGSTSQAVANTASRAVSVSSADTLAKAHGTTSTVGDTISQQTSQAVGEGRTLSKGLNQTATEAAGRTVNSGQTLSRAAGAAMAKGETASKAFTRNDSVSDGMMAGTNATMGIGPSVGYSSSRVKYSEIHANLAKIYEQCNERFMTAAVRGAFYVETFIGVHDPKLKQSVAALAAASFGGEGKFVSPVQVYDPEQWEKAHLLKHLLSFTPCTKKETLEGIAEGYQNGTILLSHELAALTHPPRVEAGGVFTTSLTIPPFTMIGDLKGEVYVGQQVSHETGDEEADYFLSRETLMHMGIFGATGTGKTTTAQRIVKGVAEKLTDIKILALDWKKSWRILKRFVPAEDFDFKSLYANGVNPIAMNFYVPPKGISVVDWMNKVHESICLAYGFGNKQKGVIDAAAEELFLKHGVLVKSPRDVIAREAEDAADKVVNVTLADVLEKIHNIKIATSATPAGRGMQDAYDSILAKLRPFLVSELRELYCCKDPNKITRIEDLINGRRVIVLEGGLLDDMPKKAVLGLITWGIFLYSKDLKSYEKVVQDRLFILEEAHEVFPSNQIKKENPLGVNEDIYQIMLNESREYGLYVMVIAQAPMSLPEAVITNSQILIVHRLGGEDNINAMTMALARNSRIDDRDVPLWLVKQPKGRCIIRVNNQWTHQMSEPVLVLAAPIECEPPDNEEIVESLDLEAPRRMLASLKNVKGLSVALPPDSSQPLELTGFGDSLDDAQLDDARHNYWEQLFQTTE